MSTEIEITVKDGKFREMVKHSLIKDGWIPTGAGYNPMNGSGDIWMKPPSQNHEDFRPTTIPVNLPINLKNLPME